MTHPKFIITMTGHLRLGMVTLHKDLLMTGDKCLGGGYYEFDYVSNQIILSGHSSDFGKPLWHCLSTIKIPKEYVGFSIQYKPDDICEPTIDVDAILEKEYY